MADTVINFSEEGMICLHRDFLPDMMLSPEMAGNKMSTRRASHVEADPAYQKEHQLAYTPWYVDLSPVNGPAMVRGFKTRALALAYEEKWINENVLDAVPA